MTCATSSQVGGSARPSCRVYSGFSSSTQTRCTEHHAGKELWEDLLRTRLYLELHDGMEMVEEQIKNNEINWQNETLACFLIMFREDEDLETSSRLFEIHTVNHTAKNIMESALMDYEIFKTIGKSVIRAEILRHFPFIVKHLMIWFEPRLYLNLFLAAVSHTLGMVNAYEQLFSENLAEQAPSRDRHLQVLHGDTVHGSQTLWPGSCSIHSATATGLALSGACTSSAMCWTVRRKVWPMRLWRTLDWTLWTLHIWWSL